MDQSFRLPLSGNVTQTINPWTWAFTGNTVSLFSVNLGRSADPDIETAVLDRLGSYGRQIGRIGEALAVVLAHVDLGTLTPDETRAIDALQRQLADIAAIKAGRRAPKAIAG